MSKYVLIVGDDKVGRKLISRLESAGCNVSIYVDRSTTPGRVVGLLRRRRLTLRYFFKMVLAELTRRDVSTRDYPAIHLNADLLEVIGNECPDAVYLFRAGLVIERSVIDAGVPLLNVHCADVPAYGGLAAIPRAIDDGAWSQHATLHRVVERIDGGEVIRTEPFEMRKENSYRENEDIAYDAGIRLLLDELCHTEQGGTEMGGTFKRSLDVEHGQPKAVDRGTQHVEHGQPINVGQAFSLPINQQPGKAAPQCTRGESHIDCLLVYPQLGSFDELLRDIPLSLIYAATDSVKHGYRIEILDLRLHPHDWREQIDERMSAGCSLVGLSVMTGNPITTSLRVSEYIKSKYTTPIVWGGPHPTILPEQTLENESIDYVIRDWGSKALCQLIGFVKGEFSCHSERSEECSGLRPASGERCFAQAQHDHDGESGGTFKRSLDVEHGQPKAVDRGARAISHILGLGYKEHGEIKLNAVQTSFEFLDYRDLPYDLVDITRDNYCRLESGELTLPIFTAVGCPYKCTFCMSPAVYEKISGKKWIAHDVEYILGHVQLLLDKYDFQRLQVYDDDSFVDLARMRELLREYVRRGYHKKLKLDFRGARINELDRMDEDFLRLMVEANVELLAIGAESGSDEILEIMGKGITVEQIIRVNRKLARFPSLKPHYNFFCGVPGETLETIIKTKELILQLVKDHPGCYLGVGADWKPLPGSVMTEEAVEDYGLQLPQSLSEWAAIDSFDAKKIVHPWYTKKMDNMIRLLQIAGQLLDRKVADYRKDMGVVAGNVIYILAMLYRPILSFRLKHNFASCLVEYHVKTFLFRRLGAVKRITRAMMWCLRFCRVARSTVLGWPWSFV